MKFEEVDFVALTNVKQKKLNFKHIFLVLGIIILIVVFIWSIVYFNNKKKIEKIEQNEQIIQENIERPVEELLPEEQENIEIPKIPIYSENAKIAMENIYNQETKKAFLTFDDGPSYNITPAVLDILKVNNIKATFFVLGSRVELYPEILKREYDEGHYIANHGYSHVYKIIYDKPENVMAEFMQTEQCIKNALGIPEYSSYLFRFPGGSIGGKYANIKRQAIEQLNQNNIAHLDWNCLTKDAEGNFSKEELLNNFMQTSQGKNVIVLLMHDSGGKATTVDALQEIIDYLKTNGYEFDNFYSIMK